MKWVCEHCTITVFPVHWIIKNQNLSLTNIFLFHCIKIEHMKVEKLVNSCLELLGMDEHLHPVQPTDLLVRYKGEVDGSFQSSSGLLVLVSYFYTSYPQKKDLQVSL